MFEGCPAASPPNRGRAAQLASWDRSWDLGGARKLCHPSLHEKASLSSCSCSWPASSRRAAESDDASSSAADAKDALADVKPISSATVDGIFRIKLDNSPAAVGQRVEFTFDGPLRSNGPGKLPSLDWKLAFVSDFSSFKSRIVSTGNNVFINLGGADFEVGEQNVARLNQSAASSGKDAGARVGRARPARRDRGRQGPPARATVGGDRDDALHGHDRHGEGARPDRELPPPACPQQSTGGQPVPQLELTPEQREQVKRHVPVAALRGRVAGDDTIRRLLLTSRFTTPEANRQAAQRDHRRHDRVPRGLHRRRRRGRDLTPSSGARPIEEFNAALQRELAKSAKQK